MGRGSSGAGSGVKSVVVDYGSEAVEYRKGPNGTVYNWTSGTALESKLSLAEIAARARDNGYTVETYNAKQTAERDQAYNAERATRPDYELGYGVPGGNREYRKTARRNRINSRAQKRRR